jgi:23S rRNA (guanosine2251-2'-O)-methyltransferase
VSELLFRRNPVTEAIRAGRRACHRLWLQEGLADVVPLSRMAEERRIPIVWTTREKLGQLAQDSSHQGVVLESSEYPYAGLQEILEHAAGQGEPPLLLLLDLLHGPQNIGTLLRAAEACGVHGVILQDRRAPDITPTVAMYAAGAAEHLLIAQVTNLVQTMRRLKEREVWLAGLDLAPEARRPDEVDLNRALGLVVGHEGEGLRRLVRQECDFLLRLPMRGRVASLNAATAGAIALYAAWGARAYRGARSTG